MQSNDAVNFNKLKAVTFMLFNFSQVLAMKYFGKRTNLKLKNVTIIHSTTAEAIRLFEENNGVSAFSSPFL